MSSLFSKIQALYLNIKSKIAFYPTLFALAGLVFAFIMMSLEELGISAYLMKNMRFLVVNSGDTALTILSTCIAGLISMMVFSFSMVMVLLNQAASDYSPRLLPGLISDHRHQIILGIYISSILYCIFILFSIQPTGDQYQVPGFSVLLGILLTIISIYAFIYFIHNISETIQITNIMEKIFLNAERRLNHLLELERSAPLHFPSSEGWVEYKVSTSGYFQDFSQKELLSLCKNQDTLLEVLLVKGSFVLKGTPAFRSKKQLSEKAAAELLGYFHLSRKELVTTNYVLAFKQMTEVIVKAMSPGINDPGTAMNAIDYLSELLRLRMLKSDHSYITEGDRNFVKLRNVKFEELLYFLGASIRTYCSGDIVVVQKVSEMYISLMKQQAKETSYYQTLGSETMRLLNQATDSITAEADKEVLKKLEAEVKFLLKTYQQDLSELNKN